MSTHPPPPSSSSSAAAANNNNPNNVVSLFFRDVYDRIQLYQIALFFAAFIIAPFIILSKTILYTPAFEHEGFVILFIIACFHFAMVFYDIYWIHFSTHFYPLLVGAGAGGGGNGGGLAANRWIHITVSALMWLIIIVMLFSGPSSSSTDSAAAAAAATPSAATATSISNPSTIYKDLITIEYFVLLFLGVLVMFYLYETVFMPSSSSSSSEDRLETSSLGKNMASIETTVLYNVPVILIVLFFFFLYTTSSIAFQSWEVQSAMTWSIFYYGSCTLFVYFILRFNAWGKYLFTGNVLLQLMICICYAGVLYQLCTTIRTFTDLERFFLKTVSDNHDSVDKSTLSRFHRQLFFNETVHFKDTHPAKFDQIYSNFYDKEKLSDGFHHSLLDIERQKFYFTKILIALMFLHLFTNYPINVTWMSSFVAQFKYFDATCAAYNVSSGFVYLAFNIACGVALAFIAGIFQELTYTSFFIAFECGFGLVLLIQFILWLFVLNPLPGTQAPAEWRAVVKIFTNFTPSLCVLSIFLPILLLCVAMFNDLPSYRIYTFPTDALGINNFLLTMSAAVIVSYLATFVSVLYTGTPNEHTKASDLQSSSTRVYDRMFWKYQLVDNQYLYSAIILALAALIAFLEANNTYLNNSFVDFCNNDANQHAAYQQTVIDGADHLFKQQIANQADIPLPGINVKSAWNAYAPSAPNTTNNRNPNVTVHPPSTT